MAKSQRYDARAHEHAFRLWVRLGSYRKAASQKGMPAHTTLMDWAGNFQCPHHCPWHNWNELKAKLAQNAPQIGTAMEIAAEDKKEPDAGALATGADNSGIPADLIGLVRSRKSKLRVIRAIEGLGMQHIRALQQAQASSLVNGESISMGEVGKAMSVILRMWDEERLELGKPTQIIGADLRAEVAVLDVAEVLKELDGQTRAAFVSAYRRHLAGRRAVTSA